MAISFDAEALIGRLNILESAQFQYAGTQAMRRLGFRLRTEVGREMEGTFNRSTPRTVNSTLYRETGGLSVGIFINPTGDESGQSPASYLYPVSTQAGPLGTSGPALTTRFTKALRNQGVISSNTWALNWLGGTEGVPSPGLLKAILSALNQSGGRLASNRSKYAAGGARYFSAPDLRSSKSNTRLAPGLYRVKGREQPVRLIGYTDKQPVVPRKFDFEGVVRERSRELLPGLLREELARALR
jgi:hypothetical protein